MSTPTNTELPVSTGHTTEEARDDVKLEQVRATVLVVEDDPANRELLVEMLDAWGYEALPVGTAEDAEYVTRRKLISAAILAESTVSFFGIARMEPMSLGRYLGTSYSAILYEGGARVVLPAWGLLVLIVLGTSLTARAAEARTAGR